MLQLLKQRFCLIFEYNSNKLNKDEAASSACRDQRLFVKRSSCPGATAVPEFTARPRGRTGEPRAGESFLDQRISSCRRASTSHTTETQSDQGVELLQATCVCLRRRPDPLMWDQHLHQTHRRKHLRDALSTLSSSAAEEEEPQTAPLQSVMETLMSQR